MTQDHIDAPTLCQLDFKANGADWTALAPDVDRATVVARCIACLGCPIVDACRSQGVLDSPHSSGVWGARYFLKGRAIDPIREPTVSIYRRVHWDKHRGKWKAEAQIAGKRYHITYGDNEDEVGRYAHEWTPDGRAG